MDKRSQCRTSFLVRHVHVIVESNILLIVTKPGLHLANDTVGHLCNTFHLIVSGEIFNALRTTGSPFHGWMPLHIYWSVNGLPIHGFHVLIFRIIRESDNVQIRWVDASRWGVRR